MYQGQLRKVTLSLLLVYTLIVLYFLYFGVGRLSSIEPMRIDMEFDTIPLNFPSGRPFSVWLHDMGNFIGFIPFGIVIPLLYRCNFIKFSLGFLLSILLIETLQMVTGLGTFNVNDITINTLGSIVGYLSQRVITSKRDTVTGMAKIAIAAILFATVTVIAIAGINVYIDSPGSTVALNDSTHANSNLSPDEELAAFVVNQETYTPQVNKYTVPDAESIKITGLDGIYKELTGYIAITDNAFSLNSDNHVTITFVSEENVLYEINYLVPEGEGLNSDFQVPLQGADSLEIYLSSEDGSAMDETILWDTVLIENSYGQRALNSLNGFLSSLFNLQERNPVSFRLN
ncbi:VanZ family protein [Salinicoccus sesuvii]|uniref:VanZ family protein n=1 Tax=Salinicoccus sesuvii TaxID=868281 RepID=A0ABV7N4K4_9STAP